METLLELYIIPLVLLFPAVIINREELNGCSTLINLTQLIWGMLGHPAWPAQNNISPANCLQQHPWTGTQGRAITNYVHKTFPQALSKLLIIFCSGSSDIVSCLVTQRSFFEIFFYSFYQPIGFILLIFWWDDRRTYILEDRIASLCMENIMGKTRWELCPCSN